MRSVFAISALSFMVMLGFLYSYQEAPHDVTVEETYLSSAAIAAPSPDRILSFASARYSEIAGIDLGTRSESLQIPIENNLSVAGLVADSAIEKVACHAAENFAWTIPSENPSYLEEMQHEIALSLQEEGYDVQYLVSDKVNPEIYLIWSVTKGDRQLWLNWRVSALEEGQGLLLNVCDFNALPPADEFLMSSPRKRGS